MSRIHRFPLRLLCIWLGLALCGAHVVMAAAEEDAGKSKKSRKGSSKSVEKPAEEAPRKKKRKEAEPEVETAKPAKPTVKVSSKSADRSSEKGASKPAEKSNEEPAPRKKRRREPETDTAKSSSKTSEKESGKKTATKTSGKSSGRKAAEKSETVPVSKSAPKDTKDVTDQKADRPQDEKAMHEGEGEFENDSKSKEEIARGKSGDKKASARTSTTSRDMQGWEVVHYQDRDWVTSNSIFRFYRFSDHHVNGNVVMFTSPVLIMKAVLGSQELLINNIKFILSNPVEEVNGKILFSRLDLCKLIDPVLRPSYIGRGQPFDTVIVDAGHGGYDSGARGLYGYEKNFALQLAALLKADLEKRGLKVVLTRSDDTFISLGGRVEFANKVPNSIFVSLHFNSGQSAATGIETYALSPQGASSDYGARSVDAMAFNGNQRDSENIALATAIHASVVHHFKLVDRGVKRARWYVLTGLERPGVLFEGGFVTNSRDGQLIAADNFRRELAHTIGDAISNYRRALQPSAR